MRRMRILRAVSAVQEINQKKLMVSTEAFYKDFFEPPRHAAPPRPRKMTLSPQKAGTVRFHEEVRVKNIKAKGKNLPLNTLDEEDDDDDDEEDFEGLEEAQFGEKDDGEEEEDDDEEEEGSEPESDENSLEDGFNGTETIERLKNDLFAEEDDEPPQGIYTFHLRTRELTH
jgi:U3 small nucleolar RNA-associated protein MPP10